jgi:hypothetical protein
VVKPRVEEIVTPPEPPLIVVSELKSLEMVFSFVVSTAISRLVTPELDVPCGAGSGP